MTNLQSSLSPSEPRFITVTNKCGSSDRFSKKRVNDYTQQHGSPVISKKAIERTVSVRDAIGQALKKLIDVRGEDHPDLICALITMGESCSKIGNDKDATYYYREALKRNRQLYGLDHSEVADNLLSLALSLEKEALYDEAVAALDEALEIHESNKAWIKIVNLLNHYGNFYFHQGMMNEAIDKYIEALNIAKKYTSLDSSLVVHVADILNNVASAKAIKKNYKSSTEGFNTALELQIDTFGEDDPGVATTLHNIGTMNYKAGKYDVALKAYKQVLKMRKSTLGVHHPSVSDALVEVGRAYRKKREYKRAERAFKESLFVIRKTVDTSHEKVADIFVNIGVTAKKSGNKKLAKNYFMGALEVYENVGFGSDHSSVQAVRLLTNKIDSRSNIGPVSISAILNDLEVELLNTEEIL